MTATAPMRIGVVGAGKISDQYLANLAQYPDVTVAFLANRTVARAPEQAARYGISRHGTYEELLADPTIELVLNLTPPAAHVATTSAALAAGKHVWSEKPLATTVAEATQLQELARSLGLQLGGAPDTFLGSAHQGALTAIRDGEIGAPRSAVGTMQYWGPDRWHPNPEFLFHEGAGPLYDMGPYWLSLLVQVFGPARSAHAHGRISRPERTIATGPLAGTIIHPTVPTYVSALIEFASGATATLIFSFEAEIKRFSLEVMGDTGALVFADPNEFDGEASLVRHGMATPLDAASRLLGAGRGLGVVELARSIRGGEPARTNGELALHVLDIMEAVASSADQQRTVEITSTPSLHGPLPHAWDPRRREDSTPES